MEWPPSQQKMLNIIMVFMIYIGGCLISYNIWFSLMMLFIGGTFILSDIGDLLRERESRMKKEKEEKMKKEENELGFNPVQ